MQSEIEIVGTPEDNNPFKKKRIRRTFRVTDVLGLKKRSMKQMYGKKIDVLC